MAKAAAAEQFDMTPEVRAFTEKSVAQARQAVESYIAVAQRALSAWDDRAQSARKGAKDISQKMIAFSERNISGSFEFAQRLVRARDVDEMLKLHGDYVATQMKALADQARELGAIAGRAAGETAKPKTAA
jgi:phasin